MLLRQLFNHATFSYTYLLADPVSSEAVLIDPVKSKARDYVKLFSELGLTPIAAIDTHFHDDRMSGSALLSELWGCAAIAGAPNDMPGLTRHVEDGDVIQIGGMQLSVIHTPGHSENSYSFLIEQPGKSAVFTGDTLLVRTVGLSNQATSNPRMHYDSLYNVLAELPDRTLVYPGRDFKGWPLSTIGEEKNFNPYLRAKDMAAFLELKARQKPADIQPRMKVEEALDQEIELKELAAFATPVEEGGDDAAVANSDFYLPDETRSPDAAAPQKRSDSADAVTNIESTESDSDTAAPMDDASSVPSWR
jgi:sulfur dioxygenase